MIWIILTIIFYLTSGLFSAAMFMQADKAQDYYENIYDEPEWNYFNIAVLIAVWLPFIIAALLWTIYDDLKNK